MRVREPIADKGRFWLPGEDPDQHAVYGDLNVSEFGEVTLETFSTRDDRAGGLAVDVWDDDRLEIPKIIGLTPNHGMVILQDCIRESGNPKTEQYLSFTQKGFWAHVLFTNAPQDAEIDLQFETAGARIELLNRWFGIRGFEIDVDESSPDTAMKAATIRAAAPDDIYFVINHELTITIKFLGIWPIGSQRVEKASLSMDCRIVIESARPCKLDYFRTIAHQFCRFIALASDSGVMLTDLWGRSSAIGNQDQNMGIFYQSAMQSAEPPDTQDFNFLFRQPDLGEHTVDFLRKWFELEERVPRVTGLVLADLYGSPRSLDVRLLELIQAASLLAQDRLGKSRMQTERAIRVLLAKHKKLFGGADACKKLAKSASDSRNYFAHLNPKDEPKAATDRELVAIWQALEALLRLALVEAISPSEHDIVSIVRNRRAIRLRLDAYRRTMGLQELG